MGNFTVKCCSRDVLEHRPERQTLQGNYHKRLFQQTLNTDNIYLDEVRERCYWSTQTHKAQGAYKGSKVAKGLYTSRQECPILL